jgi:uncharacterized protein YoxC
MGKLLELFRELHLPILIAVAVEYFVYLAIKLSIIKSTSNTIKKISNTVDKLDKSVSDIEHKMDKVRKEIH